MILCDECSNWYHFECVGVTAKGAKKIKEYKCPTCKESKETSIICGRCELNFDPVNVTKGGFDSNICDSCYPGSLHVSLKKINS
jgi:hypothetical protein